MTHHNESSDERGELATPREILHPAEAGFRMTSMYCGGFGCTVGTCFSREASWEIRRFDVKGRGQECPRYLAYGALACRNSRTTCFTSLCWPSTA